MEGGYRIGLFTCDSPGFVFVVQFTTVCVICCVYFARVCWFVFAVCGRSRVVFQRRPKCTATNTESPSLYPTMTRQRSIQYLYRFYARRQYYREGANIKYGPHSTRHSLFYIIPVLQPCIFVRFYYNHTSSSFEQLFLCLTYWFIKQKKSWAPCVVKSSWRPKKCYQVQGVL